MGSGCSYCSLNLLANLLLVFLGVFSWFFFKQDSRIQDIRGGSLLCILGMY